jgi:PRTRC genetic system protein C
MALQVSGNRVFKFNKDGKSISLEDPNLNWSPETVMSFYANQYTELVTGTITGPDIGKNDEIIYQFGFTPKTKG